MDPSYQEYALAHPSFYESPGRWQPSQTRFPEADRAVPAGWAGRLEDAWFFLSPAGISLPAQGWKIHVSPCIDEAARVLSIVYEYCIEKRLAFKFVPARSLLVTRNMKYASRGSSGKFMTIYPADLPALERTLTELGRLLDGIPGPYVLSDLRWGKGPLYVRYGGFTPRLCRDEYGELVPAIEDERGRLVPDRRPPMFRPPEWVALPDFLRPHQEALGRNEPPAGFSFRIERALHYSNGGGLYLAEDTRTGAAVVLKEARPYTALDARGVDAVARLGREWEFIRSLSDVDEVVRGHEYVKLWEHHFLVVEYIEGQTLNHAMVERYPLVRAHPTEVEVADYTAWALDVCDRVEAAIDALHRRGIVFGDLHPNNVMLRPDGRIVLIDFELAYRESERPIPGGGAPGYAPPDGRTGPAVDRYALACLRLSMFVPLTILFALDATKTGMLVAEIRRRFPVPADYGEAMLRELRLPPAAHAGTDAEQRASAMCMANLASSEPEWDELRAALVLAMLDSATPERTDRLFPGDVQQFAGNGLGMAYGAAGVLHALFHAAGRRLPEHEQWLLRSTRAAQDTLPAGFYDGLHGIAYALEQLGHADASLELLTCARRTPLAELPNDLFGGLAGVGLNLLHFARVTGDGELRAESLRAADRLAERLDALPPPRLSETGAAITPTGRAGLLRGTSGAALFFVRLYECTGDAQFLDRAERALAYDVRFCTRSERDDIVLINEGWRITPYLASGSAGVGVVLQDFLRHRPQADFAETFAGIQRVVQPEFFIGPSLFGGRAGLMAFLARQREPGRIDASLESNLRAHRRRLAWHAIGYRGGIAFPGEQLMKLSMDLATGSAGVLLALAAVRDGTAVLPFLEPRFSTDATER